VNAREYVKNINDEKRKKNHYILANKHYLALNPEDE